MCELFNNIPTLPVLIVSPCCMPRAKKKTPQNIKMREMLKTNTWCNYDFWCLDVYTCINKLGVRKDINDDKEVESEKSKFITALKIEEQEKIFCI